ILLHSASMAALSLSSASGLKCRVPQNNNKTCMPFRVGVYKPPLQLQRRSFKILALVNDEELGPSMANAIDNFLLKKYTEVDSAKHIAPAYNSYIKWLRYDRRLEDALQLTRYMEQKGIPLTSTTYFGLITDLCSRGELNEALELFNKIKSVPGCEPNTLIYATVIERLCKEEQIESSLELVGEMMQRGMTPYFVTVAGLVEAMCQKGYYSWAIDLVDVTCPPDIANYKYLIRAFQKARKPDLVSDLFKRMQERGMKADSDTLNDMLSIAISEEMNTEGSV
ncbi:hypothetical protein KI387_029379, partial [Taxus chinensis]